MRSEPQATGLDRLRALGRGALIEPTALSEPVAAGLRERLLLLRRVNSFGRLSDHAMLLLAEHARVRRFADGDLALAEGRLEHVHIVAAGRFDVTRCGKPVAVVMPGGAMGALSAVARDSRGVTARAVGPGRTLEIPIDVFLDACEESFPVLRVGLRVVSRQLLEAFGHFTLERGAAGPARALAAGPMPLIERVIELSERGLFRHWNANAVFDVARTAVDVHLDAGQPLWPAGERADAAYHLVDGEITCREDCPRGRFAAGAMLGLLETLGELPYQHTPLATRPCRLLRIPLEDLLAALDTHRDLTLELVAEASRKLLPGDDPPAAVIR
jgi:CRP-like cAMP-binding protein